MLERLDSLAPGIRRECLRSSYKICGREALLPKSLPIPLCYDPADIPQCAGGFADVWKGEHEGQEVAAKVVKLYRNNDLESTRRVSGPQLVMFINELDSPIQWFCKEVVMWRALRHPNVLPLLGVTMSEDPPRFVMVSEWMKNGNINEYLKRVEADRLKLVCLLFMVFTFTWY